VTGPLPLVRHHVAALVGVPVGDVELDLDRDLLAPEGYEVAGVLLDSLTLVGVVTALEDAYGPAVQDLLDRGGPLTLRALVAEVAR
jgi:hypothetical protein